MQPIRSVFEDDPDMLEIIREFATELPQRANEIEGLLAGNHRAKLQTAAHQLKGAGGGYGFQPITDSAGLLEHALKHGQAESVIKERCSELCEILRAVVVPE
jgi:HPt (histidine-containing phosphotransfer) domain-containing protein